MEHPAISVTQIKKDLTLEEIQETIVKLRQRLTFAYGMGQQPVVNQLHMVIECYERAQIEMLDDMFGDDDNDPTKNIDVS